MPLSCLAPSSRLCALASVVTATPQTGIVGLYYTGSIKTAYLKYNPGSGWISPCPGDACLPFSPSTNASYPASMVRCRGGSPPALPPSQHDPALPHGSLSTMFCDTPQGWQYVEFAGNQVAWVRRCRCISAGACVCARARAQTAVAGL